MLWGTEISTFPRYRLSLLFGTCNHNAAAVSVLLVRQPGRETVRV